MMFGEFMSSTVQNGIIFTNEKLNWKLSMERLNNQLQTIQILTKIYKILP